MYLTDVDVKLKWQRRTRKCLLPLLLLTVFLAGAAISAEESYAYPKVYLNPGDTFDVTKVSDNTTVFIKKSGDYTLMGQSRKVRVLVQTGGVDLYLADGLDINCSALSYVGSRTAPIWVENQGGTVRLISKKNAQIRLEGYMCPAIRKEGTSTKLVFETEDPGSPGTIRAYSGSSDWNDSPAAIGSTECDTGNMTFNSGNVYAKVRGNNNTGAGIGGGCSRNASNITINGGKVEAHGTSDGAGIGAGAGGVFTGFYMNGGTVYAENDTTNAFSKLYGSAAIGGGDYSYGSNDGPNARAGAIDFYFKGGKVTAISHGPGAAIGGGSNSGCSNLNIQGGTINASNDCKRDYTGAGIGGGFGRAVDSDINISGGFITAKGGPGTPAIGSTDSNKDYKQNTNPGDTGDIRISGGTIIAGCGAGARGDIGTRKSTTTITGGCVYALSTCGSVVNGDKEKVHLVKVSFRGENKDGEPISDLKFQPEDYDYGMNDAVTLSGNFYAWFPDRSDMVLRMAALTKNNEQFVYQGNVSFSDKSGNMDYATDVLLETKSGASKFGRAWAIRGEKALMAVDPPVYQKKGYKLDKYYDRTETYPVAHTDGTLIPDPTGESKYTDKDGKWIFGDSNAAVLMGLFAPIDYKVRFDPNVPKNASTSISGTMADQAFKYDESKNLSENRYRLPGYDFEGWNTEPDGSGASIKDKGAVKNLTDQDGGIVTLYAQWAPKQYTILFVDMTGDYKQHEQMAYFDQPGTLDTIAKIGWTCPDHTFHGWTGLGMGSFYDDGEEYCNLCSLPDQNGDIVGRELSSDWIANGSIKVTTTVDGVAKDVTDSMSIIDRGSVNSVLLSEDAADPGHYTASLNGLPEGEYQLMMDSDTYIIPPDKQMLGNLTETSTVSVVIDYYTVTIDRDDHVSSANIKEVGTADPWESMEVPDDTQIVVGASTDQGYHFDGYSWSGVAPTWEKSASVAGQRITVHGKVDLTAHAEANVYTVRYDVNAASGSSGAMEDQDFVYDEPQELFSNRFARIGATFKGWNTKADGSGSAFADGALIDGDGQKVLAPAEDRGKVTLYAQWDMIKYGIRYDLKGGQMSGGKQNPMTYTAADSFTLYDPQKKDYQFLGWIGTDITEPQMKVTVPENSTGDREYTAVWHPIQYTVKFVENGGTGPEYQIVDIHKKAVRPEDPIRDGYDFVDWYADKGLTELFDFDQEITRDTLVYAKWKKIPSYKVKFETNGGSKVKTQTVKRGETAKKPKDPTRKGYSFAGWYANKKLTQKYSFQQKIVRNTTVYAKWKVRQPKANKVLMAYGAPSGKTSIKVSWTKVKGAAGYQVCASQCGTKFKVKKTVRGNSLKVAKIGKHRMKAHTTYSFTVKALDKKGKVIATGRTIHVIAGRTLGRYANITKITAKKKTVTLKQGKKVKVGAVCRLPKGKRHIRENHCAVLRYTSDTPKVASVNKKGVVKGKQPGKATIYIQDTNGMYCRTVVTVK